MNRPAHPICKGRAGYRLKRLGISFVSKWVYFIFQGRCKSSGLGRLICEADKKSAVDVHPLLL